MTDSSFKEQKEKIKMLFWQEKDINLIYLLPMSSAVLGTETAFKSTSEKTKYKYAKFTKGVFN